jgi:hypothetical protein
VGTLFGRRVAVTVGIGGGQALRVTGLDVAFRVSKTLAREPNTAEVQLWNLAPSTRQRFEAVKRQRIRIEAGYGDGLGVIFEGDLRKGASHRDGPAVVTTLEAADGERAYRGARVNRSFGPDTSLRSVIESVARSLGLGLGNLDEVSDADFEGLGQSYAEGTVVSGPARDELDGLLRSAGIEWLIQDGVLQLLVRDRALRATAVRLTPGTGLVESPSLDSENVLRARALLQPGIYPGRKVVVESEFITGTYRVQRAEYLGDTRGGDWIVEIEGKVAGA